MTVKAFVDTNVLVYAYDRGAGAKHERALKLVEKLWQEGSDAISAQVLQEFYVNVRRKAQQPISPEEARSLIADYLTWEPVVNDGAIVLEAIDAEGRYQLSFWDAPIAIRNGRPREFGELKQPATVAAGMRLTRAHVWPSRLAYGCEHVCVIFDVDGTLVESTGFDTRLYIAAVRDVLGDVAIRSGWSEYEHVSDAGILLEICEENGISFKDSTPSVRRRFGELVEKYLREGGKCSPTHGAVSLFSELARSEAFEIGIATGGWGHTAQMKLGAAGFCLTDVPIASADHHYERARIMEYCRSCLPSAEATIYVGDSEWDQRATEQLGWEFVGVGNGLRGKCDRWVPRLSLLQVAELCGCPR